MEVSIDSVRGRERVTRAMATRETRSAESRVLHGDTDGASEGEGDGDGNDPEATVWIAPRSQVRGHSRCFHTDPTCRHVDRERFHEMARERAGRRYDLRVCSDCAGTASKSGRGEGHYQALLAAARDDGDE